MEFCDYLKLKDITHEELNEILAQHKLWLESGKKEGKCADLSRYNLCNVNFSGLDLRDINFSYSRFDSAYLDGANLSGSECRGADFVWAKMTRTNFSNAILNRCIMSSSNLRLANFTNAQMFRTTLEGAELSMSIFEETDLTYANFAGAKIHETNFQKCFMDLKISWRESMRHDIKKVYQSPMIGSRRENQEIIVFHIMENGSIFVICSGGYMEYIGNFENDVIKGIKGDSFKSQYLKEIAIARKIRDEIIG